MLWILGLLVICACREIAEVMHTRTRIRIRINCGALLEAPPRQANTSLMLLRTQLPVTFGHRSCLERSYSDHDNRLRASQSWLDLRVCLPSITSLF